MKISLALISFDLYCFIFSLGELENQTSFKLYCDSCKFSERINRYFKEEKC